MAKQSDATAMYLLLSSMTTTRTTATTSIIIFVHSLGLVYWCDFIFFLLLMLKHDKKCASEKERTKKAFKEKVTHGYIWLAITLCLYVFVFLYLYSLTSLLCMPMNVCIGQEIIVYRVCNMIHFKWQFYFREWMWLKWSLFLLFCVYRR